MKTKALIINFNRLTLAVNLANWCFEHGLEPIFIDNNSDYPLLLEYYEKTNFDVFRLTQNCGHTVVWNKEINLLDIVKIGKERYIVTDSDLDLTGVPDDFLKVMNAGLDNYPVDKCGLSLEINDLPNTKGIQEMKHRCEMRYWQKPLNHMYFKAATDTTFALYREGVRHYSHSAIRTNRPYTARHVPWYYTDISKLPEDEQYYLKTANDSFSGKKRLLE